MIASCGFCGRRFESGGLAGSQASCPQCGAAATIAPIPLPPPPPPSSAPFTLALWTLITGIFAWVCAILLTPVTMILGFIALSKAQQDPITYAPARRRAVLGLALGGFALAAHVVGFFAIGIVGIRQEKKEIAEGDALYERGDFAGAKIVYEKHQAPTARDQRTKVWLRLGHIYAAEGNSEAGLQFFERAVRENPYVYFSCKDARIQQLYMYARAKNPPR